MTIIKVEIIFEEIIFDYILELMLLINYSANFACMCMYESIVALAHHSFGGDLFNVESLLIFNASFFFSLKFLIAIFFLILIRGGIPRYRYDYLTKLG